MSAVGRDGFQRLGGLAARSRGDRKTLLVTVASVTTANDDTMWARHVAARLPAVEHRVLTPVEHPAFFTGLPVLTSLDEPTPFTASAARVCHLAQVLTSAAVSAHLGRDRAATKR